MAMNSSDYSTSGADEDSMAESDKIFQSRRCLFRSPSCSNSSSSSFSESSEQDSVDEEEEEEEEKNGEEEEEEMNGEEEEEEEINGEEEEEEINGEEDVANIGEEKNGEEGELNTEDLKIPISSLVDFTGKVLEEITDDFKEFYKELSTGNFNTLSKFKDELLAQIRMIQQNQMFSGNGEYTGFLVSRNEMVERFCWTNYMHLPSLRDSEVKELKRKWVEQEAVELEVASKRLALVQEEHQLMLSKLRAVEEL